MNKYLSVSLLAPRWPRQQGAAIKPPRISMRA
jgi:hypothetical protein